KQEKTLLKLQKDQTESTKDLAVEIEELKLERQKSTKAAKEQAKENQGLTNTLDKQRKRLNELQRELTNAAVEGRLNEESVKDQREEFEKLFTTITEAEQEFGNFRRQVGNYEKAGEDARKATERLEKSLSKLKSASIAVGAVVAGGGLVGKALKSNQDSLDALRVGTEALDTALNSLLASGIKGVQQGLRLAGKDANGFEKVLASLGGAIGGLVDGASDFIDVLELQAKLTEQTIAFEKTLQDTIQGSGLLTQLAKASAEFEILSAQADLNTISLEKRAEIIEQATKASERAFGIEKNIAKERVKLLERQVKIAQENGTIRQALLTELTNARVELIDVESRQTQQAIQNAEVRRQILQDQVELELDILIDSFDNQKTINERQIANTRNTIKERKKLFKETADLADESFEAQKKSILSLIEEDQKALKEEEKAAIDRVELSKRVAQNISLIQSGRIEDIKGDLSTAKNEISNFLGEIDKTGQSVSGLKDLQDTFDAIDFTLQRDGKLSEEASKLLRVFSLDISEASKNIKDSQEEITQSLEKGGVSAQKLNEFLEASPIEQAKLRKELGFSEIINTRILEVSRERRTVIQDLLDLQNELNDSEFEQL
ncbi:MAG: hypothetical protein KAJ19_15930, partial [Gammaproteobacteria bacterium]|nr:hypothetical protein [Gammaproteobacteria bacterium]